MFHLFVSCTSNLVNYAINLKLLLEKFGQNSETNEPDSNIKFIKELKGKERYLAQK